VITRNPALAPVNKVYSPRLSDTQVKTQILKNQPEHLDFDFQTLCEDEPLLLHLLLHFHPHLLLKKLDNHKKSFLYAQRY
jgi:hypothetical protein